MTRKFFIGWVVVFVVWMAGSFVVHGMLLREEYAALPSLFRPEADSQKYFPLMILAHVIMAGALVWIYARGIEAKSWVAQGIRFGMAVSLLGVVPTYTIYYVVQPMPGRLVVQQIVFDTILVVLLGVILGFLYRQSAKS